MSIEEIIRSMPVAYWLLLIGIVVVVIIMDSRQVGVKGGKHRVKDGTLGDARFATDKELNDQYGTIVFDPQRWRKDPDSRPTEPGLLIGDWHTGAKKFNKKAPYYMNKNGDIKPGTVHTRVCSDDVHSIVLASSGSGKTAYWLAPNLEYAMACGISILTTDTKGDLKDQYAEVAKMYGYTVWNFDLGHPMQACRWNIMHSVNKYVDLYNAEEDKTTEKAIQYLAKAETYAKTVADVIINSKNDGQGYGSNSYFYDSAQGLLQACILLVSEYADEDERHIISVYKLVQALSGAEMDSNGLKVSKIKSILDILEEDDKIRMFAGSSENATEASESVSSTVLSRLLQFLDSEIESMLCGDSDIDAEYFALRKTIIFITMPEEKSTRYFLVSLLVEELYNELLTISREHGNKVPATEGFRGKTPRIQFFLDEAGTLPAIANYDLFLSAARSRNIFMTTIIQNFTQLEKNYGKAKAATIRDNSKLIFVTGLAPLSDDINVISKTLGEYTVETNSVSSSYRGDYLGATSSSHSKQMTKIPLMGPNEIQQELKKGKMLIIRTTEHPCLVNYDLFLDWGITYGKPITYEPRKAERISYVSLESIKQKLIKVKEERDNVSSSMQNAIKKMEEEKAVSSDTSSSNVDLSSYEDDIPVYELAKNTAVASTNKYASLDQDDEDEMMTPEQARIISGSISSSIVSFASTNNASEFDYDEDDDY